MHRRILVTGGCGFIGSAVCRRLVGLGHDVINLDRLTYAGHESSLAEVAGAATYRFIKGDVADADCVSGLLSAFQPDAVIHLAAESHVDRSIDGPEAFIHSNTVGTFVLLEGVRRYWNGLAGAARDGFRLLHVSTDEVFGSLGQTGVFTETTAYDPRSPYSASKAAADHLVSAWAHTYGLPTLISNCSNNYGPYQLPEKLIPLTILNALEGRPIPIYGDGGNVRDWLYVEDHVDALLILLERGRIGQSYVVGGRSERTNLQVARSLCAAVDSLTDAPPGRSEALIAFVPDRPGHDRRYAADPTRIEGETGWRAQTAFEVGIERTVAWYLANRSWWEPIRRQIGADRLGLTP
jgi:dTDP-glucose 4,6-dehydratase